MPAHSQPHPTLSLPIGGMPCNAREERIRGALSGGPVPGRVRAAFVAAGA